MFFLSVTDQVSHPYKRTYPFYVGVYLSILFCGIVQKQFIFSINKKSVTLNFNSDRWRKREHFPDKEKFSVLYRFPLNSVSILCRFYWVCIHIYKHYMHTYILCTCIHLRTQDS